MIKKVLLYGTKGSSAELYFLRGQSHEGLR